MRTALISKEGSLTRGAISRLPETRHQPGAQQNADGLRRQADSLEPDAPERQKNTVAKK
jgi:hypothetical protein